MNQILSRATLALLAVTAGLGSAAVAQQPPTATDDASILAVKSPSGWPGFRGPRRDGVSADTGLLDEFPVEGPKVLWRVDAFPGYSGVSIEAGRAFTSWQEEGKQRLIALDVASGRVLWKHELGAAFSSSYGDGPRSTPIIDEGRVYAIDARGHLAAVRADDGRKLWSHDLGRAFGARIPSIGFASTPLIEGNYLLVEVGAEQGAFMAFDKVTGEVAWSAQSDEPAYASPIALTSHDLRQVVFFSASGLYSLAPGDGRLLWRHPWTAPCPATGIALNAASPVFIPPDRVFVSAAWGDSKGGAVLRLIGGEGSLAVEQLWHAPLIDGEINTAVLFGNHLYGFKGNILVSMEAATGELNWSARGYGRGSLIAADGKLIVLSENGELALVEANPRKYRELAKARVLTGRSWTSPSLADGRLFLRNSEEIVSLDLTAGAAGSTPPAADR